MNTLFFLPFHSIPWYSPQFLVVPSKLTHRSALF
jgi:hypothetical protein